MVDNESMSSFGLNLSGFVDMQSWPLLQIADLFVLTLTM